jgi:hypothetical protein
MHDPDLYVDVDALELLVLQLDQIRVHLDGARDAIDTYDARLGSERIEEALDGFVSGWKDGRKQIVDSIDDLLARCRLSIDTYRDQERQIVRATGQER